MSTKRSVDLDRLAAGIVKVLPTLVPFEQRLSLELYRLLAAGQSVPRTRLAERVGVGIEVVNRTLDGWPGVFSDSQQRIVGYWGLSIPTAYAGPHGLTIDGRRLSAWCAWDTLFLPQLLGKTGVVESTSPVPGAGVSLLVTPKGVEQVRPADVHMSFLLPDAAAFQKDIVSTFCHFVHFFPSREAGESWNAQHPGTFTLSIAEAHTAARRNELQYGYARSVDSLPFRFGLRQDAVEIEVDQPLPDSGPGEDRRGYGQSGPVIGIVGGFRRCTRCASFEMLPVERAAGHERKRGDESDDNCSGRLTHFGVFPAAMTLLSNSL